MLHKVKGPNDSILRKKKELFNCLCKTYFSFHNCKMFVLTNQILCQTLGKDIYSTIRGKTDK